MNDFIAFNDLHYFKFINFIRKFGLVYFDQLLKEKIDWEEGYQGYCQATHDQGIVKFGQGSDGNIIKVGPEWF